VLAGEALYVCVCVYVRVCVCVCVYVRVYVCMCVVMGIMGMGVWG
jgi:hypothetical protein